MAESIQVTASFQVTIPPDKVLVDRAEWESVTAETLEGRRWTTDDVLKRIGGYRRSDLTDHVLLPKLDELKSTGALLSYPRKQGGEATRWLFRATEMAKWLEANAKQITDGGWKS